MNFPCDICGYPNHGKQEAYIRKLLGSQEIITTINDDTGEVVVVETSVVVESTPGEYQTIQVFL